MAVNVNENHSNLPLTTPSVTQHTSRLTTSSLAIPADTVTQWPAFLEKLNYVTKDAGLLTALASPTASHSKASSSEQVGATPALNPSVVERSDEVAHRMFSSWHDPKAVLVYNLDFELDDTKRLAHVLTEWSQLPADRRANLVVIAGERTGVVDTFSEAIGQVRQELGLPDLTIDETGTAARSDDVVVLRGAPLKGEDKNAVARAAERLADELNGRQYVFHNNTSEHLFASMPKQVQAQCLVHTCTCDVILTPKGVIYGANQKWAPSAYAQSLAACNELNVPFVGIHGSTLGFTRQSLSELPGWSSVLEQSLADPRYAQGQIRFSMQQVLVWTARIVAALESEHGQSAAASVSEVVSRALGDKFGTDVPATTSAWAAKAQKASTYSEDDCTIRSAGMRARAIAKNLACPLNNTMGDYAAAILDSSESPRDLLFLPVELQSDATGKPMEVRVGLAASTRFLATNGREEDFTQMHEKMTNRGEDAAKQTVGKPIVDHALAEEWTAFTRAMEALLQRGLQPVEHETSDTTELHEHLRSAQQELGQGTMSLVAGIR